MCIYYIYINCGHRSVWIMCLDVQQGFNRYTRGHSSYTENKDTHQNNKCVNDDVYMYLKCV